MLGRRTVASAAVFALLAAGCTTVAPEQSAPSSLSSSASPLAPASVGPSFEPSLIVTTPPPSVDVATPKPSKSPKPPKVTPSPGAAGPNLVVTKFVADADPFVSGVDAHGHVTIKNAGSVDAGSFSVGVSYQRDDGLGEGSYSAVPVDGLAAGDSVQVPVTLTLQDTGAITFTATADSGDAVVESNENDNTKTLSVNAVAALPNLVIDEFSLTVDPSNAGMFTLNYTVRNAGTADVNDLVDLAFNWVASGSGQTGLFLPTKCCPDHGPKLAAGDSASGKEGPFQLPSGDTYTVTAAVDPDNKIQESDETDNYATDSANVP
jgi:hypothetical protein